LFPFNSTGGEMNTWSRFAKRIRAASGLTNFGWHDLRRTFNSELAEHDIGDPDTVDACLNHRQSDTRRGVRGVYNRAKLTARKEAVMRAWGELVAHAVEHGEWPRETKRLNNVVPMRSAAS
jgi:integrase